MSYSNYSTYLKYKNCCRPIGDTGPPGPAGPTGPAATIDISGSKGEILYFSETDNLVNTDNVFIQEANVTINNNLVVTGTTYLNNTLDVSGSTTIQNGILKVLNPNDKKSSQFQTSQGTIFIGASNNTRFGDVSYNLIFSTGGSDNNGLAIGTLSDTEPLILGVDNTEVIRITDNGEQRVGIKTSNPSATLEVSGNVIINGNLSMSDQFINDVSGIFFSDGTYIGLGSSFDITTSERLDISAAAGVTVNGNLTVNDATTVNKTFHVIGNTTLENLFVNGSINNLIEISGNTIQPIISESVNLGYDESGSSNDKRFNLGFFNKIKSRTAVIVGNLTMDDSSITNVDNITSVNNLTIQGSDGVTIRGNLTVDDATTFQSDTTINSNLTINNTLIFGPTERISSSGSSTVINTGDLTINGPTTIDNTLTIHDATTLNGNLNFKSADHISSSGSSIAINTIRLTLDAATTINSNLSMNNNYINDISYIQFSDNHNGQIFSPLERNSFLLYDTITTNASFKECIFNYNDTSYNGLISPQIFNTTGNVITFSNSILNNFNYATFSLCCSGILNSGPKNDIIFDLNDSTGKLQKNILIDTRSISGNGSVAFGPVNFKITDISNTLFNRSIFKNNQYKLRVKSGGSSKYNLTKIRLAVNLI